MINLHAPSRVAPMADRPAGYLAAANAAARLAQKSDTEQVWLEMELRKLLEITNNNENTSLFMILDDIVNINKLQE